MGQDSEDNTKEDNGKFKDGVNRNARLIVRNISFKATEEALYQHFSKFGNVEEVKLLKKPDGRLVGCGFIHYTHVPMANKALLATNKKPFLDRPIQVAWAVPKQKYEQIHGTNNRKQSDSISLENEEENDLKENTSKDIKNDDKSKTRVNRNARLIIRNISFKATEESLKEHFEPFGSILEVKLLKKPDGKLVGCAFVHFKNVPMAKKALLNTNMKPFLGRPISVDWAVPKDKYMQHIVNQELEMQEKVKKEDSDSDDNDGPCLNFSNDEIKDEIKSESDDDSEDEDSKEHLDSGEEKTDDEKSDDENSDNTDSEESDVEQDDEDMDDVKSETSTQIERKRVKLNDAEDGCTVFVINIPFSVDNDQLKEFAERAAGPVKYALVCMDKMTEHSKGSGFIKFMNQEDADKFLSLPPTELKLEGQVMQPKPALKKENVQKGNKKQPKDNRNLYLVKEGVVVAGTKAAEGVSASDMSKRLALERSKTQMLKNLNRFVSRYRLVVSNLPPNCNDGRLRRICTEAAGRNATITEARVMRDFRSPVGSDGKHPSKGYGFVMFMRHEDALTCLRKLNNNPEIFDKNNRPIVSFSIEDRTALNARKKRLEKSIANNPLTKKDSNNEAAINRRNRKRKSNAPPDESYVKKGRIERKEFKTNETGKFVKRHANNDFGDYTGLTAKEGTQHKMRSNQKLRAQADVHRQNVKLEKKKSKRAMRLKNAAKERIKLPKQKINKNKNTKRNKKMKSTY